MTVSILGTKYTIVKKKYTDDETFERRSIAGYCDGYAKKIVVCDMHTYKGWEHESEDTISEAQKLVVRHEIVHAFLDESGLTDSAHWEDGPWSKNEEMVEWIASQGLKIFKAWQYAGVA